MATVRPWQHTGLHCCSPLGCPHTPVHTRARESSSDCVVDLAWHVWLPCMGTNTSPKSEQLSMGGCRACKHARKLTCAAIYMVSMPQATLRR